MATIAIMVETAAMTIVVKAKTTKVGDNDIPMTRISPVNYTERDTVQKNVLCSKGELANNSSHHLAEISIINSQTVTVTTSPISTITSLLPTLLVYLSITLRLLLPVIHSPG